MAFRLFFRKKITKTPVEEIAQIENAIMHSDEIVSLYKKAPSIKYIARKYKVREEIIHKILYWKQSDQEEL